MKVVFNLDDVKQIVRRHTAKMLSVPQESLLVSTEAYSHNNFTVEVDEDYYKAKELSDVGTQKQRVPGDDLDVTQLSH